MKWRDARRLLFWDGALAIGFITPSFVSIDPWDLMGFLLLPCIILFAWYAFLHSPQIDKKMLAITLFFTAMFSLAFAAGGYRGTLWAILCWLSIVLMSFLKWRLDRSLIDTIRETILLSFSAFCLGLGITFRLYGNEIVPIPIIPSGYYVLGLMAIFALIALKKIR